MRGLLDKSVDDELLSSLQCELGQVVLIFEQQLASDLSTVNRLCVHIEQYRGKMLRPMLVLLSAQAAAPDAGPLDERLHTLAAVVEMIHMATLVHDDVLDEAAVRRRGATVNALWGNELAVMLGDYLISNAFHLCSRIGDPSLNLALGGVTNTLCEGELLQLHHRDHYSLDEQTYFEIIGRKTASLTAACCRLGAKLRGANDAVVNALAQYGRNVGIAFQLQDDLLDLVGETAVAGKSLGLDLKKGKLTLPLILHLNHADHAERAATLELIASRDAMSLRARLLSAGAVEAAREHARSYITKGKDGLQALPASAWRDVLALLADRVLQRNA